MRRSRDNRAARAWAHSIVEAIALVARQLGSYQVGALLGRGATSEVYAGERGGEQVAIKMLHGDDADALIAEATRLRAIVHPNVVRVLDAGRDDGRCFLVMERLDGETLAARLARVGRLGEDEVRELGAAIADGAAAAHAQGIVHRDLKPANVMLAGDDVKLVDFGIARELGERGALQTARRIGTPAYMAPEQLSGGLIAPCVDVWALGVILFEMASGALPFHGFDDGRCPQLFETAPRLMGVSSALAALVARCLERDPGRRPASMAEVARGLRAPVGDERHTQDLGEVVVVAAPRARARWPWIAAALAVMAIGIAAIAWPTAATAPAAVPATAADAAPAPDAAPAADAAIAPGAAAATAPDAAPAAVSKHHPHPHPRPKKPITASGETLD